jgi:ribonuclease D
MAAIQRGLELLEADLPRMPRGPRHRPDPIFDARLERLKALRAGLAAREDLAPGVLCPNWLLEAIARAAPTDLDGLSRVEGIRRWQVGAIGSDLLKAVPIA